MPPNLPAVQNQKPLLPARLNQKPVEPVDQLGGAIPGVIAGGIGAAGTIAAGAALAKLSPAIAALASNPVTMPLAALLGGITAAFPFIYNKWAQSNTNKKIQHSNAELQKLRQNPNQNDPAIQQQIQQHEQALQKYGAQTQGRNFSGQPAYNEQIPLYSPENEQWRNSVLQELTNNPAQFGPIKEEAIRRFHEETAPRLAEQYFGRKAGSSFGSSYPEALGRGGAGLERQLASDEQRFNAAREAQLMNVANQPSFATAMHPRQPGLGESLLTGIAGGTAEALTKYAGNSLGDYFGNNNQETNTVQANEPQSIQSTNQPANQQPELSQFSPNNLGAGGITPAFSNILKKQFLEKNSLLGGRTR